MPKKSYLNTESLLSESFFSKLRNKLTSGLKLLTKTSRNKKAMNDPRVKAAWAEVEEASTHAENTLKDWYKKHGLEYPG